MSRITPKSQLRVGSDVADFKGITTEEDFGTGVGVDPSDYESYTLLSVRDTLAIGGLSAAATNFYLIQSETAGFLNDPFDGIVGTHLSLYVTSFPLSPVSCARQVWVTTEAAPFSRTSSPTASQVRWLLHLCSTRPRKADSIRPAVFSLALLPHGTSGSELTLGGIDTTKYTKALTYIPVVSGSSFWELKSTQFSVNGKSNLALSLSHNIIFDSGEPFSVIVVEVLNT